MWARGWNLAQIQPLGVRLPSFHVSDNQLKQINICTGWFILVWQRLRIILSEHIDHECGTQASSVQIICRPSKPRMKALYPKLYKLYVDLYIDHSADFYCRRLKVMKAITFLFGYFGRFELFLASRSGPAGVGLGLGLVNAGAIRSVETILSEQTQLYSLCSLCMICSYDILKLIRHLRDSDKCRALVTNFTVMYWQRWVGCNWELVELASNQSKSTGQLGPG